MLNLESNLQKISPIRTAYQIPTLMPDEYWIGYLGRLLVLNGISLGEKFSYVSQFLKNVIKENNTSTLNSNTFLKLAALLEIDLETLVQRHSIIHFVRQPNITRRKYKTENGLNRYIPYRFIKKESYFCKSCISEDMSCLGFSFWRRSHQLPGIDWCIKHDCPLSFADGKYAMYAPPNFYLRNEIYSDCQIREEVKQNLIIEKFIESVQVYADKSFTFNIKNLADLLAQRACELDIVTTKKQHGKFISDFLTENTPICWRRKHFPNLNQSTMGKYLNEFDDILRPSNEVKLVNILLITSAFLPNSADIFNKLTEPAIKTIPKIKPTISEEIVYKAYIKHNGQVNKIAEEINCNYKLTSKFLTSFGYYPLKPISQTTVNALIAFNEGVPIEKLLWKKAVNVKQIFLITHPGIKGMREILNSFKIMPL